MANSPRASSQIATTRSMSRCTSGAASLPLSLNLRFIGIAVRSWAKPACISALMLRARARASGSAGHMRGSRSARYSAMAMLSQIWKPSTCRQGTRPLPEIARRCGLLSRPSTDSMCSRKGMLKCFSSSQGRSDQDE